MAVSRSRGNSWDLVAIQRNLRAGKEDDLRWGASRLRLGSGYRHFRVARVLGPRALHQLDSPDELGNRMATSARLCRNDFVWRGAGGLGRHNHESGTNVSRVGRHDALANQVHAA